MNLDEFLALPEAQRWQLVYEATIAEVPPPKYDVALYTREGRFYASECDAGRLAFEIKRADESAAGGGEWADKDRKKAEKLRRFLAWRKRYPSALWAGVRDDAGVTAAAPSRKPHVTPRGQRAAAPPPPDDYADDGGKYDDNDIPF